MRLDKTWELFESQLKTNLNFRVHRLHLMDYRQRSEESVDDFVTRARTQALKCEFEESELEERIIELMIASTPIEAFQCELLEKAKGYNLTDALAEGRRFKAILAGRQEIHKRTSTPLNNVDQVGQACGNCGRAHPPRACPAYKDSCKFCGKIGHWKKKSWKRKGPTVRKKMFNNVVTPNRMANNIGTPFGRHCWTRLPFGLRVSQDIFKARMDEILEDLPGVVGITDDVCVHGKDEEEHDRNLKALMDRAKETGLVFNSDKVNSLQQVGCQSGLLVSPSRLFLKISHSHTPTRYHK